MFGMDSVIAQIVPSRQSKKDSELNRPKQMIVLRAKRSL
jgi:hypothetical protein